jgi:peptide/nickel transport system permease protein
MGIFRDVKKFNWALILGMGIVVLVVLVGYLGPHLSIQDPMAEHFTLRVNGKIRTPPYPAFTIPGYPLGTDSAGRDIFSRLLWAIRPTLTMVTTVALVRLFIGILLGLIVGWQQGFISKILEALVTAAVSIPVLIVAIIGITAIGLDKGLFAFVIGLSLTGWAETARSVALQTKALKEQTYVEAAHALGASDFRILMMHITRHVMPYAWMLLAFEISATFLVVAELGFLGYYLGGGAWVEILDFVAVNIEGLPELGQMLSLSLVKLTNPSALLVVSSVVFVIILGFNLLGEGLRIRTRYEGLIPGRWKRVLGNRVGEWFEYEFLPNSAEWLIRYIHKVSVAGVLLLLFFSSVYWWNFKQDEVVKSSESILAIPGNHLWASEEQNSHGTRWTPFEGVSVPVLKWFYFAGGELSGSPVVSSNGTIIITSKNREIIALNPEGNLLWKTKVDSIPVGSPALGERGEVYCTNLTGGLTAVAPNGGLLWSFIDDSARQATSGPIVSTDGSIYYIRLDSVQALDLYGKPLWAVPSMDTIIENTPVLSPQESFLFLKKLALAANSGARLKLESIPVDEMLFTDPTFFVGADNQNYFRSGGDVYRWRSTENGVELDQPVGWDFNIQNSPIFPKQQGVTPQGILWLFFSSDWMETRLVSIGDGGRILSNVRFPEYQGILIAIDKSSFAYFCSSNFGISARCHAIKLGTDKPLWDLELGDNAIIVGSASAPGVLYIALKSGYLIAVGNP